MVDPPVSMTLDGFYEIILPLKVSLRKIHPLDLLDKKTQ